MLLKVLKTSRKNHEAIAVTKRLIFQLHVIAAQWRRWTITVGLWSYWSLLKKAVIARWSVCTSSYRQW